MPFDALTCLGSVPSFLACFRPRSMKLVGLFYHALVLSIVVLVNLSMYFVASLYLACWP